MNGKYGRLFDRDESRGGVVDCRSCAALRPSLHARMILVWPAVLSAALSACGSTPAPGVHGRWKAVNHFAETTQAIPLHQSYAFYPSPLDGTLKAMLIRWAQDSSTALSYSHPYDFTLHAPVAQIHTNDLQQAVQALTTIYAPQGISITATKGQIVVRSVDPAVATEASPGNPTNIAN